MTAARAPAWRAAKVTLRQVTFATTIAFLAWAFAVYDFILFGTLLPEIGGRAGWSPEFQAIIATWVAAGTGAAALLVGPLVDKHGRRFGIMFAVGGAAVCSALTSLAGTIGTLLVILVRSASGLGYAEQGINGTYLSELYVAAEDPRVVRHRGFLYALVQGGWPFGAVLAAALTAILLPRIGWQGCFLFAAIPSLCIAILARYLRETPQFEATREARRLRQIGEIEAAASLQRDLNIEDQERHRGYKAAFQGGNLRPTLTLSAGHALNWFTVQIFNVLGTTVLTSVHHITFRNSLLVLVISNLVGYVGYLTHGYFGDRLGRRNVIAFGWTIGGLLYAAMLLGPDGFWTVICLYSLAQFFQIGPYACMLFFVGESFPSAVRGTGTSIVTGIGPLGAILASFGAAMLLRTGHDWMIAALLFGALPCALSGFALLSARPAPLDHSSQGLVRQAQDVRSTSRPVLRVK